MTDQLAHARIRVAEIPQRILDRKVRPLLGARMLAGYVKPLKAEISLDAWKTVVGIASETDGMPIGSERQYWAPEPLREKDKRADDYEQRIAADLLRVAEDLLHVLKVMRSECNFAKVEANLKNSLALSGHALPRGWLNYN